MEEFRGDHLIFGRKQRGSVITENPKAGIAKNLGRIQKGTTQSWVSIIQPINLLENKL